ncbi:unnamed protein product [Clavelina lepadiformis]|uniref:Uncharacterized protein n=1 Tax=Clavelina lepadiformis TaxID=159417 RepID=A0ABP0FSP6_CLALP
MNYDGSRAGGSEGSQTIGSDPCVILQQGGFGRGFPVFVRDEIRKTNTGSGCGVHTIDTKKGEGEQLNVGVSSPSTYGDATIVMPGWLKEGLDKLVQFNGGTCEIVFPHQGKALTSSAAAKVLQRVWKLAGGRGKLTATSNRKHSATQVRSKRPDNRLLVAKHMAHSSATQERYYANELQNAEAEQAYEVINEIREGGSEGRNVGSDPRVILQKIDISSVAGVSMLPESPSTSATPTRKRIRKSDFSVVVNTSLSILVYIGRLEYGEQESPSSFNWEEILNDFRAFLMGHDGGAHEESMARDKKLQKEKKTPATFVSHSNAMTNFLNFAIMRKLPLSFNVGEALLNLKNRRASYRKFLKKRRQVIRENDRRNALDPIEENNPGEEVRRAHGEILMVYLIVQNSQRTRKKRRRRLVADLTTVRWSCLSETEVDNEEMRKKNCRARGGSEDPRGAPLPHDRRKSTATASP